MGLYFLYILFFILAPIGYGVALGVFLKEYRLRQLGITAEEPAVAEEEESPPPEPEAETAVEEVAEAAPEPVLEELSVPEPPPDESPEAPSIENVENVVESETAPKSVFDDQGLLPKSFKADKILDDMLDEDRPEIPADLSSRIEEETDDFPQSFDTADDDPEDDFFDLEDDALARAMEIVEGEKGESIDFSSEMPHPDAISPTVRDLLGEDFDFDSLAQAETPKTGVPLRELADGTYQTETEPMTNDLSLRGAMPDEQDIISVFPERMIQNAVIEPDRSEDALEHSFVEETRPMFVRRSKGVKE